MSRPLDPRLLQRLPKLRRLLVQVGVLQTIGALLTLAQASLLADLLVTAVLTRGHRQHLLLTLCELAAVCSGRAIVAAVQEWVGAQASVRFRSELRRAAIRALTRLGPAWNTRQERGQISLSIGPGLDSLDGYVTRALPALVAAAIVPGIVLVRIGLDDWRSAVLLAAVMPLVPLFMVLVGMTTRRQMTIEHDALGRLAGHFLDLLQGIATIKIYGQSRRQIDTVRRTTEIYRRQTMKTLSTALLSGLVLDVIATLSVAVVAVAVGLRLDHGGISLRTALIALLLAPELFAPLRALGTNHHASEEGLAAAGAVLDVLDQADLLASEHYSPPVVNPPFSGLTLENISLRYDGRDRDALHRMSLEIPGGQLVALTGRSGSGKSSLLAILLRFTEPTAGRTWSGRQMMGSVDPDLWRLRIAWLPQRPRPTQPTAGLEVALANPAASTAQIEAALAECHAPSPDTRLGEAGNGVSAGQRRRIALARVLLRVRLVVASGQTPLVLLDEPTEDLDRGTETIIADVIATLAGVATVIMVTHSPSLVAIADREITLEQGAIVADRLRLPHRLNVTAREAIQPHLARASSPKEEPSQLQPLSLRNIIRPVGVSRRLGVAVLLAGLTGLCGLALTATSLWLICRAAQHPNVQAIAIAVVGVRTFALGRAALRYSERLLSHDVAMRILADLRARVFGALVPLAPGGLAEFRRGDLLRRFVSDIDGAQEGLVRAVVPMGGAGIAALGAVTATGLILPSAGFVLALGVVVAGLAAPWLSHHLAGPAAAETALAGQRDALVTGTVEGLEELTAYGAQEGAIAHVESADGLIRAAAQGPARAAMLGVLTSGIAAALTTTAVLGLALGAVRDGRLSVLRVAVLLACCLSTFDTLAPLPSAFAALGRCHAGLLRVSLLLSQAPPVAEPTVPGRFSGALEELLIENLTLLPAPGAAPVLDGASLLLTCGQRVAITGSSGTGKTTLLAAVLRLAALERGDIVLGNTSNEVSIGELSSADLPPRIAGSLQGDHVFNASLRDNLRFVRPEATDTDLEVVAARAGILGFIRALPDGWGTQAGADGNLLSGGERQRLLLARALLAAPEVLVLDEPTAHLDAATERAVMSDLLTSTSGQTVILSTHRALRADQIDANAEIVDGLLHSVSQRTSALVG